MDYRPTDNRHAFNKICQNQYGREVIYTHADDVNDDIVAELKKALPIHEQNVREIQYLDNYYKGNQRILYRVKKNRPEINNKVVVNCAQYVVDTKVADLTGEPIQFVLHGTDESKTEELKKLIDLMGDEDKACDDVELVRWRSICGTAYRFVNEHVRPSRFQNELNVAISVEDPTKTFIAYYDAKTPAFSCQIRKDKDGNNVYYVYTNQFGYKIIDNEVVEKTINGNGAIPVIEYPNNARRLSDIEITISLTDEINKLTSDRANAVESYVCSWVKFINCDIDIEKFREVRDEGFFSVTSNNGAENRSDVELMAQELNQTESQVAVNDLFDKLLVIQGIANREGNTGGDTGSAVFLRNGGSAQEQKAKISENIFVRSEKMALRLILNRLRVSYGFKLEPKDVEIKITRCRNDNMLTKAETLQILINCGIEKGRAIKTVDMWSDPEQVALESKDVKTASELATETALANASAKSESVGDNSKPTGDKEEEVSGKDDKE